jgi:galactitol-specific phosphotransferase system IIB component
MEENNINNAENESMPVLEQQLEVVEPIVEPVVEPVVVETKVEEVAVENNIQASVTEAVESNDAITTSDFSRSSSDTVQSIGSVENGVIGVAQTPRPEKKAVMSMSQESKKTVAIHSTKNVSWTGVGKVYRGYNIVTPEQSEKWLTRNHIRLATPEEVAKEFGR